MHQKQVLVSLSVLIWCPNGAAQDCGLALELGQTILEDEVQREVQVSAPTRVRSFLSRFMVVVIVARSIESLVAVFHFAHGDTSRLIQAAAVGVATCVLVAAWGPIHLRMIYSEARTMASKTMSFRSRGNWLALTSVC